MKAWVIDAHGEPADVLRLRDVPRPAPGEGQLLVQVETAGLGFPDVLRIRGKYQIELPVGCAPGQELVGIVRGAGPGTSTTPGTRILGVSQIGFGALAEYVLVNEGDQVAIDDDFPADIGAALPANYGTAHIALHIRGALSPGDSVVIAGGAGGVGSAAIQLAKAAHARVFAIDSDTERANMCRDFGADDVAAADAPDLADRMKAFSGGGGINLVIDMVGGDVFEACRKSIASEGRIVIVGFMSGTIPEIKLNRVLFGNFSIVGMNAFHYADEMARCYRKVADLVKTGELVPPIDSISSFSDALEAFSRLTSGVVRGKALVRVDGTGSSSRPSDG